MQPHPGGEGGLLCEKALDAQFDPILLGGVALLRVVQPVPGGVIQHREDLDILSVNWLGELVVEVEERRDARLQRNPVRLINVADVPPDPVRDDIGHDTIRVEELGHGHVPKLHVFDTVDPVCGHQIVAHGEDIRLCSFRVPNRLVFRRCASIVVDCQDL